MRVLLAMLLLLPGCVWCDSDHALHLRKGTTPVAAGAMITLELESEGFRAGPNRCGGHWYVDTVEGGDERLGTITTCGVYTAPALPRTVTVQATEYELGGCADCCPYGERTIEIVAN
jgi:hypothetical protein